MRGSALFAPSNNFPAIPQKKGQAEACPHEQKGGNRSDPEILADFFQSLIDLDLHPVHFFVDLLHDFVQIRRSGRAGKKLHAGKR
jgi:hypothetical protein